MAFWDLSRLTDVALSHRKGVPFEAIRDLRDLAVSLTEGGAGVPKIPVRAQSFSGLGNSVYIAGGQNAAGAMMQFSFKNGSGGSNFSLAYSIDGVNFSAPTNFVAISSGAAGSGMIFYDFATGNYHGSIMDGDLSKSFSGTLAGSALGVSLVQFKAGPGLNFAMMATLNGGASVA